MALRPQNPFASEFLREYRLSPEIGVLAPTAARPEFGRAIGNPDEQRVASAIRAASDRSATSLELERMIDDWRSLYHLSPLRGRLLDPVYESLAGPILEVGAGLGAITRSLGETRETVIALEGSPFRAAVCADRCQDLPNVIVVCDDFGEFQPGSAFQTIVMIGVLEYAGTIGSQAWRPDPIQWMLDRACSMLAPGGTLVLAIENQLGLKYLAGFPEDHLHVPMVGVEDGYTRNGVTTFGRGELRDRLQIAGLDHLDWFYPFPDFKFPRIIVPETVAVEAIDPALVSSICRAAAEDPQRPPNTTFDDIATWRVVCRNRELGVFANSFLVRASR